MPFFEVNDTLAAWVTASGDRRPLPHRLADEATCSPAAVGWTSPASHCRMIRPSSMKRMGTSYFTAKH